MNLSIYLRRSSNEAKYLWIDAFILLVWFLAVCFQAFHHVMWRDEVRALSIALGGDNIIQMFKGLHGEMMAGPFLLFWFVDILDETGVRWTVKLGNFFINAGISILGVVAPGLTILPTFNDAAVRNWSNAPSLASMALKALVNPGTTPLNTLMPATLPSAFVSAIIFCIAFGLAPRAAIWLRTGQFQE